MLLQVVPACWLARAIPNHTRYAPVVSAGKNRHLGPILEEPEHKTQLGGQPHELHTWTEVLSASISYMALHNKASKFLHH